MKKLIITVLMMCFAQGAFGAAATQQKKRKNPSSPLSPSRLENTQKRFRKGVNVPKITLDGDEVIQKEINIIKAKIEKYHKKEELISLFNSKPSNNENLDEYLSELKNFLQTLKRSRKVNFAKKNKQSIFGLYDFDKKARQSLFLKSDFRLKRDEYADRLFFVQIVLNNLKNQVGFVEGTHSLKAQNKDTLNNIVSNFVIFIMEYDNMAQLGKQYWTGLASAIFPLCSTFQEVYKLFVQVEATKLCDHEKKVLDAESSFANELLEDLSPEESKDFEKWKEEFLAPLEQESIYQKPVFDKNQEEDERALQEQLKILCEQARQSDSGANSKKSFAIMSQCHQVAACADAAALKKECDQSDQPQESNLQANMLAIYEIADKFIKRSERSNDEQYSLNKKANGVLTSAQKKCITSCLRLMADFISRFRRGEVHIANGNVRKALDTLRERFLDSTPLRASR